MDWRLKNEENEKNHCNSEMKDTLEKREEIMKIKEKIRENEKIEMELRDFSKFRMIKWK